MPGAMTVAFEVERFERVDASSGTALLRLSGSFRAETATELGRPELLVDDGRRSRTIRAPVSYTHLTLPTN